jgi:formylglycine-generating enzyme required for sulfatase activity
LICRSAFRDRLTPSDRGSIIGFRLSLRSASFR